MHSEFPGTNIHEQIGAFNGDAPEAVPNTWWIDDVSFDVEPYAEPEYELTTSRIGNGVGTIKSSPAGINCGADCSQDFLGGTEVTLTRVPAANSYFAGWSGDCSGSKACTVTMNEARSVTAEFTRSAVHDHTIALRLRRHLVARGEVIGDGFGPCVSDALIKVQRRSAGKWNTIKKTTSTATATYRVSITDRPGRYRVSTPRFSPAKGHICAAQVSTTKSHQH